MRIQKMLLVVLVTESEDRIAQLEAIISAQQATIQAFLKLEEARDKDATRRRKQADRKARSREKLKAEALLKSEQASVTVTGQSRDLPPPPVPPSPLPDPIPSPPFIPPLPQEMSGKPDLSPQAALPLGPYSVTAGTPKSDPAQQVFEHWREASKHRRAVFGSTRRKRVEARLREGFTVEELCQAIDGCLSTPWNLGKNEAGQRYDDLELICRDAPHVERYRETGLKLVPIRQEQAAPILPDNALGRILGHLRSKGMVYAVEKISCLDVHDESEDCLWLLAGDRYLADWVQEHYAEVLNDAVQELGIAPKVEVISLGGVAHIE